MNNQPGISQFIGIVLIFGLLAIYFFYLSPKPPPATPASSNSEESLPPTTNPKSTPSAPSFSAVDSINERLIRIETPAMRLAFSTKGAQLIEAELTQYNTYQGEPLSLLSQNTTLWQQALLTQGQWNSFSNTTFTTSALDFTRLSKDDSLVLSFATPWQALDTLRIQYAISGASYQVKVHIYDQGQSTHLRTDWLQQIPLSEKNEEDFKLKTTLNYVSKEEGFDKFSHDGTQFQTEVHEQTLDWVCLKQPFFLAALFFHAPNQSSLSLRSLANPNPQGVVKEAQIQINMARNLQQPDRFSYTYYLGPNDRRLLVPIGQQFERNVALGWGILRWINQGLTIPFFNWLQGLLTNYGWIIVALSIAIRIVVFPLTYRSYVSMAKMKLLKPEVDALKKEHADDQKKQQQSLMQLYQSVGINPLSGCVPMLLQMPILLAMFYFFPNAIMFRQKGFLWVDDLSTYDSILDLPFSIPFYGDHVSLFTLLMTLSTLLYTFVNTSVDSAPPQMKFIQYFMPILFLFFLNSYSASLTFYYFVSNMVSIGQQTLIKRFVSEERLRARLEKNRAKRKKSGKSDLQSRIEAAMKARSGKKR